MLVAGFSNRHFYLHEMSDFNLIHSLRFEFCFSFYLKNIQHSIYIIVFGDQKQMITLVLFNPLGDWVALVCQNLDQFVVWEWQSQRYVLK